jgi:hypothetical protein
MNYLIKKFKLFYYDWYLSLESTRSIASNSKTKESTLRLLAESYWTSVRYSVARNPNTSPKTLEQLATDENSYVRYWVAQNPNTSPKTLEKLATDENSGVRYWVTENSNTPHYVKKCIKFQYHMTLINLSIRNSKYA